MRWRTIEEVKAGKGAKICANVACGRGDRLEEMEVAFGYTEDEKQRSVLVKCVLCEKCARKLKKARGTTQEKRKRRRSHDGLHHHHRRRKEHTEEVEKGDLEEKERDQRKRRRNPSRERETVSRDTEKRDHDSDKHEVHRRQGK